MNGEMKNLNEEKRNNVFTGILGLVLEVVFIWAAWTLMGWFSYQFMYKSQVEDTVRSILVEEERRDIETK